MHVVFQLICFFSVMFSFTSTKELHGTIDVNLSSYGLFPIKLFPTKLETFGHNLKNISQIMCTFTIKIWF